MSARRGSSHINTARSILSRQRCQQLAPEHNAGPKGGFTTQTVSFLSLSCSIINSVLEFGMFPKTEFSLMRKRGL